MAIINSDNRDAWQQLANDLAAQYPSKGKRVRVTEGKHKGTTGLVVWHGRNKFYDLHYKTDAQLHLMDMAGRAGFRVLVFPGGNGDKFFVDADKVEVIDENGNKVES